MVEPMTATRATKATIVATVPAGTATKATHPFRGVAMSPSDGPHLVGGTGQGVALPASDVEALNRWLDDIGETDPAIRAHLRHQCETEPAALACFLALAAEAAPPAEPIDRRRTCTDCVRLAERRTADVHPCHSRQAVVARCDRCAPLSAVGVNL